MRGYGLFATLVLVCALCFIQSEGGRGGGGSRSNVGAGGWSSGGRPSSSGGAGGWVNPGGSRSSSGSFGGRSHVSSGTGGWVNPGGSRSSSGSFGGRSHVSSGTKKKGIGGLLGGLMGKKTASGGGSSPKTKSGGLVSKLKNAFKKKKKPGYGSGGIPKKKGGKLKTLKKAAVIGAVAYGGYKIGKLTSKFSNYGHHYSGGSWGFNDWNKWRKQDGFMCRNDDDCRWIDRSLSCQEYEFDFQPSQLWFGGDVARIVGSCQCRSSFSWNDNDLSCISRGGGRMAGSLGAALIAVIVIVCMFSCCCCIGCAFILRRFLGGGE